MIAAFVLLACSQPEEPPTARFFPEEASTAMPINPRVTELFAALPDWVEGEHPVTEDLVALGRLLYHDNRLSNDQQYSCNSCHNLKRYGMDGKPTSIGPDGSTGLRNTLSTYNSAMHVAQYWDGRAADVETQAQLALLSPTEMAMPSEEAVVEMLRSIPVYVSAFEMAFPEQNDPIRFDNVGIAIGAFQRGLLTPGPFDAYVNGDAEALTPSQVEGLILFMDTGCTECHMGAALGGSSFQKLGAMIPWQTTDLGVESVSGEESDRHVFRVPSLRNVTQTAPYLHDGSSDALGGVVRRMAQYQLGKELTDPEVQSIMTFLGALTGKPREAYIMTPDLPPSGPDTPTLDVPEQPPEQPDEPTPAASPESDTPPQPTDAPVVPEPAEEADGSSTSTEAAPPDPS